MNESIFNSTHENETKQKVKLAKLTNEHDNRKGMCKLYSINKHWHARKEVGRSLALSSNIPSPQISY